MPLMAELISGQAGVALVPAQCQGNREDRQKLIVEVLAASSKRRDPGRK